MNNYSLYHKTITKWQEKLATIPNSIFLGQQVASEDFYNTLCNIPMHKRREMPVMEECQLGISIGLSLVGYLPICIIQRCDFIPRLFDQLVNHLVLLPKISRNLFTPKIILRTTIGTINPLDCGLQHSKDLTKLLRVAVDFPVFDVKTPEEVNKAYNYARKCKESVIVVEHQSLYYNE